MATACLRTCFLISGFAFGRCVLVICSLGYFLFKFMFAGKTLECLTPVAVIAEAVIYVALPPVAVLTDSLDFLYFFGFC